MLDSVKYLQLKVSGRDVNKLTNSNVVENECMLSRKQFMQSVFSAFLTDNNVLETIKKNVGVHEEVDKYSKFWLDKYQAR
jgi:hypothetical protein